MNEIENKIINNSSSISQSNINYQIIIILTIMLISFIFGYMMNKK